MQKKTIYTIAASHLDTSWLWDLETSIREYIPNTLFRNFKLFEQYPDYTFGFEGTYRYELMEEYYPEAFEKLKEYVAGDRWVPVGSSFENGDVNTPSPEALFRNILYGNSYFREKFGKTSNDIFLPDCFGFGWALPSIAAHANLKGFSTGKLAWGSAYGQPFDLGKWFGVDGNFIYANVKPGSYSRSLTKVRTDPSIAPKLKDNKKYNLPFTCAFYGTGDRGGAPAESSVKAVMREMAENASNDVDVMSVSSTELFDIMNTELSPGQKEALPAWNDELLLTNHGVGSYTSRAVGKRWNKRCEQLADAAERTAAAAGWLGAATYPKAVLDTAWKRFIAHQFHDDITGTSFQVCYQRNWNDYILSQNQFAEEYRAAAGAVCSMMDTSFAKGVAVAVSNPLQSEGLRAEAVEALVQLPAGTKHIKVTGADKKEVPSQIVSNENGLIKTVFLASVPSVGVAVYDVTPAAKPYTDPAALNVSSTMIENNRLRVMFNSSGDICEIYDKNLGRNVLSGVISLALFDYKGSKIWPAWELTYKEVKVPPREYAANAKMKVVEFGPARAAVEITRKAGESTFKQIVSLDAGADTVRVFNEVDWRSTASLLKAVFPLASANPKASYDLGLGVIQRGNNTEKLYEVPAQMWADLTKYDGSFGVSVFSDSRAGWDKPDDGTLRLTAVHTPLYNFRWECSQHLMDLGLNRFSFGIFSHAGGWQNGTQAAAARFNQPMAAFVTDAHKGELPPAFSFARVSGNGVIIRALKKANEGDELIVRFNEGEGKAKQGVRFSAGSGIESAREVFASEEYKNGAVVENGELVFDMTPYEPKTFALTLAPPRSSPKKAAMTPLELPYNAKAFTVNADRAASELPGGLSLPAETLPDSLLCGGVEFTLRRGDKNAVLCKGQTVALPENCSRLYILACSTDGDRKAYFKLGGKEIGVLVADWDENPGSWDLIGLGQTGYIKRDVLGFATTHAHSPEGDEIAKNLYFFKYAVDIPAGVREITLPKAEEVLLLAATAGFGGGRFETACELYDSLDKRPFDYKLSRGEYILARPSLAERLVQGKVDRNKTVTINATVVNGTFQLADIFSLTRKIFRLGR